MSNFSSRFRAIVRLTADEQERAERERQAFERSMLQSSPSSYDKQARLTELRQQLAANHDDAAGWNIAEIVAVENKYGVTIELLPPTSYPGSSHYQNAAITGWQELAGNDAVDLYQHLTDLHNSGYLSPDFPPCWDSDSTRNRLLISFEP